MYAAETTLHLQCNKFHNCFMVSFMVSLAKRTYSNTWLSRWAGVSGESNRTLKREKNKIHQKKLRGRDAAAETYIIPGGHGLWFTSLGLASINMMWSLMMLQVHKNRLCCIPLPCKHKIWSPSIKNLFSSSTSTRVELSAKQARGGHFL